MLSQTSSFHHMEDQELQQIRARRMQEMQSQAQPLSSIPGLSGMQPTKPAGDQDGPGKEEGRRQILAQILGTEARERLSRIKIVKEEKGRAVEDMIIRMCQNGQVLWYELTLDSRQS